MILSIILTLIFIGLSILHFNWVFGGQYGFAESLPTKENGERVLNPGKMDSAIVAFGLLIFGFFYLVQSGLIEFSMPDWMLKVGGWIIPIIFLLRAVGEFKYVGFFKSVKTTAFGKLDTKFFAPLCLYPKRNDLSRFHLPLRLSILLQSLADAKASPTFCASLTTTLASR